MKIGEDKIEVDGSVLREPKATVLNKWTDKYRLNDMRNRIRLRWRKREIDKSSMVDGFQLNGHEGDG